MVFLNLNQVNSNTEKTSSISNQNSETTNQKSDLIMDDAFDEYSPFNDLDLYFTEIQPFDINVIDNDQTTYQNPNAPEPKFEQQINNINFDFDEAFSQQQQPQTQQNQANLPTMTQKKTKKRVEPLTYDGKVFKEMIFFHLDQKHKKIPKPMVKFLFNMVAAQLKLPKMSREEDRSINKFYNNYAFAKAEIINAIKECINQNNDLQRMIDESHGHKKG